MKPTPLWKCLVGWLITPVFLTLFVTLLCGFHVLQMIAGAFSRTLQKHVLDVMNFGIILIIRFVAGTRYRVQGPVLSDDARPLVLVANHQSMYDIPMIMWVYRKRRVGFIAKRELGRWLPSVSYALRTLDSVLIDRKDARAAVAQISEWGRQVVVEGRVACIFPEGTRARDGVMKRFKGTGLKALVESVPGAVVQPVVVDGNWELLRYRFLPVPFGTGVTITFLEPIEPSTANGERLSDKLESVIRERLGQGKLAGEVSS